MNAAKKTVGYALATAAAAMFAAGVAMAPVTAGATEAEAEVTFCFGVNACKGQSACETTASACAGLNACQGHGWIEVESNEACEELGGRLEE